MMNSNPYSYDECLAILDVCVGLERHTRLDPDPAVAVLLGKGLITKILSMKHFSRLELMREVIGYL
ncbi:hypothetical protein WJM97_22340 [Okeanomitos corallinicola TIOX110]|uniref:Uncharacterized protein n=1 Tax=Okeanomitos corallinicola TIOX110 TaxID=3133117 RepID=A0ABZ2UT81_9CYAN